MLLFGVLATSFLAFANIAFVSLSKLQPVRKSARRGLAVTCTTEDQQSNTEENPEGKSEVQVG